MADEDNGPNVGDEGGGQGSESPGSEGGTGNDPKPSDQDSKPTINVGDVKVHQVVSLLPALMRVMDRMCKDHDPGEYRLARSFYAFAGLTVSGAMYVALTAGRTLADFDEFVWDFPLAPFLFVALTFAVVSGFVGSQKKRSYCSNFVTGIQWGLIGMVALSIISVLRIIPI